MKDSKTMIRGLGEGQIQNDNLEQYVKTPQRKTTIKLESAVNPISMQGGLLYPIGYKEVLAGEYIRELNITALTRMLTPLVPTFDKIYMKIDAWWVPHSRVWKDADKFLAGKNSLDNRNLDLGIMPSTQIEYEYTTKKPFMYTLAHRYGVPFKCGSVDNIKVNTLLFRGYRAIVNDYVINKDYEMPKTEWNTTTVTTAEAYAVNGYILDGGVPRPNAYILEEAPARKGYLTNIKSQIAKSMDWMNDFQDYYLISKHLDWQTKYNDAKQRQDNANKNDWDIIAEMGGTEPIKYKQVEHLGAIEYQLNYQQITQSTPEINEDSTPLGTTGAFSYTAGKGILFNHKEFKEHGFIHITANIQINKAYEASVPKELLKTRLEDIYRAGMADKEIQLLYANEISASTQGDNQGKAYQPPWAEYKRLPSITTGEMQSRELDAIGNWNKSTSNSQWHNKIAQDTTPVVSSKYFRNADEVNTVLARNNVLTLNTVSSFNGWSYKVFDNDPILNIVEINCETSLPIESNVIHQVEYTNDKR